MHKTVCAILALVAGALLVALAVAVTLTWTAETVRPLILTGVAVAAVLAAGPPLVAAYLRDVLADHRAAERRAAATDAAIARRDAAGCARRPRLRSVPTGYDDARRHS